MPDCWPHWQAVYYYFIRWKQAGIFEQINAALNELDRLAQDRQALLSSVCVYSQSVKQAPMILRARGLDTHKQVNGRKRQVLVDTQGRLWVALVHSANGAYSPAALDLIGDLLWRVGERLEKVYGDQAASAVGL